ncbi:hypothetical protein CR513_44340, partial [Mucuna pruriens]
MGRKTLTLIFKHFKLRCTLIEETTNSTANCFLEHYGEWLCPGWPPSHPDQLGSTSFASQFTSNKTKRLEVVNLFASKAKEKPSKITWHTLTTLRLRAGQFSDSLALRKPLTMEEIRAQAEKHIEVEEDQANRLEAIPNRLRRERTQTLHEIYHTNLLKHPRDVKGRWLRPNTQEWCEFHRAYDHCIEDCRNLQEEIERLI